MENHESQKHVANVLRTVASVPANEEMDEWLQQSWRRSVEQHRIDPNRARTRRVLTSAELRDASERMSDLLEVAKPHIDDLDRCVSAANYCVLLTDAYGATIDHRKGHDADNLFSDAGVGLGVCWSEEEEGTCGIGTTLINQRPTLVHKTEHFRADNIALSCSAAPVFNIHDELIAVLNASTLFSPYRRDSQALVFHLVNDKALLIENALAERALRQYWRLSISPRIDHRSPDTDWLLAFNERGVLMGANRPAKQYLLGPLGLGLHAEIQDMFGCSIEDFLAEAHAAPGLALPLRLLSTGRQVFGVLRAPARLQAAAHHRLAVQSISCTDSYHADVPEAFRHLAVRDKRFKEIVAKACKLANSDIPLMLLGETGTGKDAFAKSLHAHSERRAQPFVALNCAAIPESLIESELFGYREGAFTGASKRGARGKILQADGGTLFLDEIGDMPLSLQSRLLRVLAEGEVLALGAEEPTRVRLHVVCATHQPLDELVRAGRFREDLYYRLSGAVFHLPALRERDDIAEVIMHVLHEECAALGRPWMEIERAALEALKAHAWPGNIRQLRHVLRCACTISETMRLSLQAFPAEFAGQALGAAAAPPFAATPALLTTLAPQALQAPQPIDQAKLLLPRERMLAALQRHHWHVTPAALDLGMPRSTFYRTMTRLKIVSPNQTNQTNETNQT